MLRKALLPILLIVAAAVLLVAAAYFYEKHWGRDGVFQGDHGHGHSH
jgi:hypothetical protein